MKVLLVGGCGFLGRNISEYLIKLGYELRCLDCYHAPFIDELGIEFYQGSFTSSSIVDIATVGVDAIIHLACNVSPSSSNLNPLDDVSNNVCGTLQLLNAAVKNCVKRFVFISSGGTIYGNVERIPITEDTPTNPICSYGITKLAIEKYLAMYQRIHGLRSCSLRLSNPYGEYQRVASSQGAVAVFAYKALREKLIEIWGDGSVVRDFIYVGDVVRAVEIALRHQEVCGEINIGSGCATTINELLDMIECILNKKINRQYALGRTCDASRNVLNIDKAYALLGWRPQVTLSEGVRHFINWLKEEVK